MSAGRCCFHHALQRHIWGLQKTCLSKILTTKPCIITVSELLLFSFCVVFVSIQSSTSLEQLHDVFRNTSTPELRLSYAQRPRLNGDPQIIFSITFSCGGWWLVATPSSCNICVIADILWLTKIASRSIQTIPLHNQMQGVGLLYGGMN